MSEVRPKFREQWFNPAKERRLTAALQQVTATSGDILEVGSWEGRSTILIANFFAPAKVIAIDHWKGDLGNLSNGVAAKAAARDVFADFKANMDAATQGNYEVARMGWRDYRFQRPIRFIFIDGEHTYPEVMDNIVAVRDLMVPGSVIAGDDFTVRGVGKAVTEAFGDRVVRHGGPGAAIWYVKTGG